MAEESWISNTMKIFHFEGLAGPMRVDYTAQHIVLITYLHKMGETNDNKSNYL